MFKNLLENLFVRKRGAIQVAQSLRPKIDEVKSILKIDPTICSDDSSYIIKTARNELELN